jgi:hypothetical protein
LAQPNTIIAAAGFFMAGARSPVEAAAGRFMPQFGFEPLFAAALPKAAAGRFMPPFVVEPCFVASSAVFAASVSRFLTISSAMVSAWSPPSRAT